MVEPDLNIRFVQDIPLRPGDRSYELVSQVEDRSPGPVPMLIAWGMKDFVFDEPFLDEWIRRFPEATVLRFEQAGHYVLEDERDRLVGAIRQFVSTGAVAGHLSRASVSRVAWQDDYRRFQGSLQVQGS